MRKKKVIGIIGGVAVLAAVGYGLYTNMVVATGGAGSQGIPVEVTTAITDTITTTVNAKGEVSLLNSELIYSNITAEVDEVLVEKNDAVIEGQPLIRYKEKSRKAIEDELKNAQLSLRSAELSLSNAKIPPTESELEKAKLNISSAEQTIRDAEYDLNLLNTNIEKQQRNIELAANDVANVEKDKQTDEQLLEVGAATQSELEARERELDRARQAQQNEEEALETYITQRTQKEDAIKMAKENRDLAQMNYDDILNRMNEQSTQNAIAQRQIEVEQYRLRVESLQNEMADFQEIIYSPINGTVTSLNVSKGEITTTDKSLMEIANLDDYVVKVDVNERNAAKIQLGQKAVIEGAVLGDQTVTGVVSKIAGIAELKQGTTGTERVVPVEIEVDSSEATKALKPGFSLEAVITTVTLENIVVVPILSTLSEKDGSSYVFVIKEDNTLEKRPVILGAYSEMMVQVTGLSEGEKIVTQPTMDMMEGTLVSPATTNEEGAGGGTDESL